MRALLDTHALLWWLLDDPKLSARAHGFIGDDKNEIFVSAVSAMEISTKHRIGKLPEARVLVDSFTKYIEAERFSPLPITVEHGRLAGSLQVETRDPFDRLLIAQSLTDDLPLLSNERLFDTSGIRRIW